MQDDDSPKVIDLEPHEYRRLSARMIYEKSPFNWERLEKNMRRTYLGILLGVAGVAMLMEALISLGI